MTENGEILGVSVGTASIICQSMNGISAEFELEVYEVFPETIKTSCDETILIECENELELEIIILPENANNKNYLVTIENEEVATISDELVIRGISDGETNLIIQTENEVTKIIPLNVYHNPVISIEIVDENISYRLSSFGSNIIDYNDEIQLDVKIEPQDATFQNINWESSNPDIILIEDNNIVINGTGKVTLTANGYDGISQQISFNVVNTTMIKSTFFICVLLVVSIIWVIIHKYRKPS